MPRLVDGSLAAGAVAVDVAGIDLLYGLIAEARIRQRVAHRLGGHFVVASGSAGLGELDHANPGDNRLRHPSLLPAVACVGDQLASLAR
jgi:hypothetical protein